MGKKGLNRSAPTMNAPSQRSRSGSDPMDERATRLWKNKGSGRKNKGSEGLCRNLLVLAKLTRLNTSYRVGDDKQISQGSGLGGTGCSTTRVAGVYASKQPQEVHAASIVRLPRAEELLAHRLPGRGRAAA